LFESFQVMPKHLTKAIFAQLAGFIAVYSLGHSPLFPALPLLGLALVQATIAVAIAIVLRSPRWWIPIHLFFCPAITLAIAINLPAWLYASLFLALLLIYWSAFRTQVPLFLSNRTTVHRLAAKLGNNAPLEVLDAGSGTGSFLRGLARLRPDWRISGLESAPAPFWLSAILGRNLANMHVRRGDIWTHSLGSYDLVYAFLSPVPMPTLWRKALKEMKAGSLLVSNSFQIPDVRPEFVIRVDDYRQTHLFCYRIPSRRDLRQKPTSAP
jgi:SAM-dependent methyltransferase